MFPGAEGHGTATSLHRACSMLMSFAVWPAGGTTFCGIAALALMGRCDRWLLLLLSCSSMDAAGCRLKDLRDPQALIRWCIRNQGSGYRGRPEKVYASVRCLHFHTLWSFAACGHVLLFLGRRHAQHHGW